MTEDNNLEAVLYQRQRLYELVQRVADLRTSSEHELTKRLSKIIKDSISLLKENAVGVLPCKKIIASKHYRERIIEETSRIRNLLLNKFGIVDAVVSIDKERNHWVCFIDTDNKFGEVRSDDLVDALSLLRDNIMRQVQQKTK